MPAVRLKFKLKVASFAAFINKVTYCCAAAGNCNFKDMVCAGYNFFPVIYVLYLIKKDGFNGLPQFVVND